MISNLVVLLLAVTAPAVAYFKMFAYAPSYPVIDGEVINANGRSFVIGAESPTTFCGLDDPDQCPDGSFTLINQDMTMLASAVPGGQFIFVGPDGLISYPSAHSALRPPGAQMGGFHPAQILSDCMIPITILSWQSQDGSTGLWACPRSPQVPLNVEAVLKASVANFVNDGCVEVEGIQIMEAGDDFGAWAYT